MFNPRTILHLFLANLAGLAGAAASLAGGINAPPAASVASTAPVTALVDFASVELPDRLRAPDLAGVERLSAREAIARAQRDNPAIRAARERLVMARGEYRRRSAANNAQAGFGGTLVPHRGDEPGSAESQLADTDLTYVAYTFPTSGSRRFATRSAEARFSEATADLRTAELDIARDVGQSYVDLQVSQELVRVYEDSYRIAVTLTGLAQRAVQAGAVPETNVVRTRIEESRAEQDVVRAHSERRARQAALAFAIGAPVAADLVAGDPLETRPLVQPLAALVAQAMAARPEIAATGAAARALAGDVDVARSQRRPDVTVQLQPTDELTNSGNPPFKAFFQVPLWDRGRIGGEVERARAESRAAGWLVTQARRQVELDVTRAFRQHEGTESVLGIFSSQVLPHTGTLLDRARVAYLAGSSSLLDVLDAQRVYRQAALDALNAAGDLARAGVALERAVAAPVERRGVAGWSYRSPAQHVPGSATPGNTEEPERE